ARRIRRLLSIVGHRRVATAVKDSCEHRRTISAMSPSGGKNPSEGAFSLPVETGDLRAVIR
ncbi:MAG TPA: hypothetical protein PLG95_01935, partial [Methanoculleus sp.]|nr:hypothetical protein [Methanoculleus sp.]